MNALAATQTALQGWLLHGNPGIAARVDGVDRSHRLRIYADAYRLRLLEVLGNDFPATKAAFGDEAFDALAVDYLHAHPSTRPSARHFGHAFADWLAMRTGVVRAAHELARFEWMQCEAFDAVDAPTFDIDDIAGLPADAWPSLQLRLHPSARLLSLACNAPELVEAQAHRLSLPELRDETASQWLLWRIDGDVHWRRLDADEAAALHAIEAGETFGLLCERLNETHGDGSALRVASLLKRWLADGLLAAA